MLEAGEMVLKKGRECEAACQTGREIEAAGLVWDGLTFEACRGCVLWCDVIIVTYFIIQNLLGLII